MKDHYCGASTACSFRFESDNLLDNTTMLLNKQADQRKWTPVDPSAERPLPKNLYRTTTSAEDPPPNALYQTTSGETPYWRTSEDET